MALTKTELSLMRSAENSLQKYIHGTEFDNEEEASELIGVLSSIRVLLGNETARCNRSIGRTLSRIEQNTKLIKADSDPKFRAFIKGLKG